MTTPAPQTVRPVRKQSGPFVWVLGVVSGLIVSVIVSVILGVFIEWVGMHWWWKNEGVNHSKNMVVEDLNYLAEYPRSLITDNSVDFAAKWAWYATQPFVFLGITSFIKSHKTHGPQVDPNDTAIRKSLKLTLHDSAKYLTAAIHVTQDAAIRLAVVALALPAFILACLLGLIDGLGRRDIRKWSGGRESSFVYHHAKRMLWPAFTGGFTIYLTWPTGGFNPAWMVLPFGAAVAWTMSVMASTFKKYL